MKPIDLEKLEKPEIIMLFAKSLINHAVVETENRKIKRLLILVFDQHHDVLDQYIYEEVYKVVKHIRSEV